MRQILASALLLLAIGMIAQGSSYRGDRLEKGEVVNIRQSGPHRSVQIKTNNYYFETSDARFGSLDPKVGDCVKVWTSIYFDELTREEIPIPHGNSDIRSCQ